MQPVNMQPVNMHPVNMQPVNMQMQMIKKEIMKVPAAHPVFIYVAVGAASATLGKAPLAADQYQQFPPFLQNMRNTIANLHLFLMLIDPYQENPPQVAMDYDLQCKEDQAEEDQAKEGQAKEDRAKEGHFSNNEGTFQVFVSRQAVYTDADLLKDYSERYHNITEPLRDLNTFAKENRASLLYHDFSGRKTALVAEYFDKENQDHLDQIIYGLSAREDHGCFFDLTQLNAFFPFRLDTTAERPVVRMFNYYKFIVNATYGLKEEIQNELAEFPREMHPLAETQREQIIKILGDQLKNINLSLLRQVQAEQVQADKVQADKAQAQEPVNDYTFNQLPHLYRDMFLELYKEKEYSLLYELLFNYTASELDILAQLKNLVMSGDELLTFITLDEDPYKWYNTLNSLL